MQEVVTQVSVSLCPEDDQLLPGDSIKMKEAIRWLNRNGYRFVRKTTYQLKIGPLNFYPGKGTIIFDGEAGRRRETGLAALQKIIAAIAT